jgi:uncharacterized protein YjiS (DUF1127 family)
MQRSVIKGFKILFNTVNLFLRWAERRSERAQNERWLMEMDDRLLKDIGLYRADIPRLYQRKESAPAHERFEQTSVTDTVVRSQMNYETGCFSSCSRKNPRTL